MRFIWISLGVAALAGTAWADADRDVVKAVAKCAEIASAEDRLKCFDTAVPQAQAALAQPEAPIQTATTQTEGESEGGMLSWFGLDRPVTKTEDFGKPPPKVEERQQGITHISAAVAEFARTSSGKVLLVLDNGQIWRQIDGDSGVVQDPPKGEPLKVSIEKGFFGSYDMTVEGRNGIIKVRRVK